MRLATGCSGDARFICVFDICVFMVNEFCDGLLVRRKILRLYFRRQRMFLGGKYK